MRRRTGLLGPGADEGFTLVELLLAIVIIGVMTVPLGNVVLGYLSSADATTARLLESHDAQISSAYWAQDVASIGVRSATGALLQSVERNVAYGASLYPCGTAGTTPVVTLAWDDSSGPGVTTKVRVAYVVQTSSGQGELHRLRCDGSTVVVSDVTVAHELNPDLPPTVECAGASPAPTDDCAAAPGVPKTVTLRLSLKGPKNRDPAYPVILTGQRRQS